MENKWIKKNKRGEVMLFNQELNKCITFTKQRFWATHHFGVELYIIKPWNRVWFKWFNTIEERDKCVQEVMEEN